MTIEPPGLTAEEIERLRALGPNQVSPRVLDPRGSVGAGVVRLSDVIPERVSWLWERRIPLGKLTVLDGDPRLGKSTLMLDIAARVTTGVRMPDGTPGVGPSNVVLLAAEDGLADTVRPRLDAAAADCGRVVALESLYDEDLQRHRPPILPGDTERIEEVIRREHAVLVIVDVFNAYLSRQVDAYRDQDVRGALMHVANMAERTGAAVVLLRHLSKSGGGNALYRGGGSIGIIGAARQGLLVGLDPADDSRRVLAVTKSNLSTAAPSLAFRLVGDGERDVARVEWGDPTGHTADDLVGPGSADDRTALTDAVEFLSERLAGGPVAANAMKAAAIEAGISGRTLQRAKVRIGVQSVKTGAPGKPGEWSWVLPFEGGHEDAEDRQPAGVAPFGDRGTLRVDTDFEVV